MSILFKCSSYPRSFINIVIIVTVLWPLFIGSRVLSLYITPYFFSPQGGCQSSEVCATKCGELGYPAVEYGQPVPVMIHLCVDNICYCSTQTDHNDDYAWIKGRVITKYDCQLLLPAGEGEKYDYRECHIHCTSFGFEQKNIDPTDSTVADTDLQFNIVVNDDCCCNGKPVFSNERFELPEDEDEDEDDGDLLDPSHEEFRLQNDEFQDSQVSDISGFGTVTSGDQYSGLGGGSWNTFGGRKRRIHTPHYPGKDLYAGEDSDNDPVRETSGAASKRARLVEGTEDEEDSSTQAQTPTES